MKRFLRLYLLAIIAIGGNMAALKAQNPTMDAQWTVVQNDGSTLILELGVKTNTPHEHLGAAQFVFDFSNTNFISFANGNDSGVSGIDYYWIDSFRTSAYAGLRGVTQSSPGSLNVRLDFSTGTGEAISSTTSFTPVIDLIFSVSDHTKSTNITWDMNISTGTLQDVSDDGFNNFDVGSFNGIAPLPLPVTLCNFRALLINSVTKLSWTTVSEINNDYFTVERSPDGSIFSPVKQVKGSGNSDVKKEYVAYDESPLSGLSYYRLRQTDFNGASKVFNIVTVNNTNPISDIIKINSVTMASGTSLLSYSLPDDEMLTIIATDMIGNIIHKGQLAGRKGNNTYSFSDAPTWKPGIYSILLYSKDQSAFTKIFIP